MRKIKLGKSDLDVPVVAVGCMHICELDKSAAERFVGSSIELGANFFDHADIYGNSTCEEIFSGALRALGIPRDEVILQSKCGIWPGVMYDFSKEHILEAVVGSLKRLKTDYLDVLLLHRPDALVEPEEVAEAFDRLHTAGKVKYFGVSNQTSMQIRLLKKFVEFPLVANQLQLSLTNATMISRGLRMNIPNDEYAYDRDGDILDFCRFEDITVQPWSPFQYGTFEGVYIDSPKYGALNKKLSEIAEKYGVSKITIAIAWLLRHPAKMQPIPGTMNVDRLKDCVLAADITLTREEWYQLYMSAGNMIP